jgi:urease accessory protein
MIRETATVPPRAIGALDLRVRATARGSQIAKLRHSGSMRVLFPRQKDTGLMAVMLNTAGGITGGDRFETSVHADVNSRVTLTTQAAERAYRANAGETGAVGVELKAGAGARIDWLPQETILYDGSALRRKLNVQLEPDATLLAVEPLVFGRFAMGEDLRDVEFRDDWRVRVGKELVFADALHLSGDIQRKLARASVTGGAKAMDSVLLVSPSAEAYLDQVRALLGKSGGVSLIRPGVLFARALADDSYLLRRTMLPILKLLNQAELPRTWMI